MVMAALGGTYQNRWTPNPILLVAEDLEYLGNLVRRYQVSQNSRGTAVLASIARGGSHMGTACEDPWTP